MTWLRSTVGLVITGLSVCLLIAAFLWLQSCQRERSLEAQGKVDRGQQGALQNSAGDAVNTVAGVAENQMASDELGRRNEEEINNAPGASDPVNPAVRDAGLRSLCRRPAYRHDPRCRVLQPPAR